MLSGINHKFPIESSWQKINSNNNELRPRIIIYNLNKAIENLHSIPKKDENSLDEDLIGKINYKQETENNYWTNLAKNNFQKFITEVNNNFGKEDKKKVIQEIFHLYLDEELLNEEKFSKDPFLQYAIKNNFFSNNFSDQFGENSFEKFLEHYIKKPDIFLHLIKNMSKDEIISASSSNNHEKNNIFHKLALNCEFSFDTKDLEINSNKSKMVDFSEDSNSRNQRKAVDADINSHASYEITNYQEALFSLLLINSEGLLNEKNSDGLKPYEVCIKNSNYFLARLLKGETDIFIGLDFKIDPEKDIQKLINENIYLNLRKKISAKKNNIFFKQDIGEELKLMGSSPV